MTNALDPTNANQCSECGCVLIHDDIHETACSNCGLVVPILNIYPGPEWISSLRDDNTREDPTRANPSSPLHADGVSASISRPYRDIYGQPIDTPKWRRLRDRNAQATSSKIRHLRLAIPEIRRVCSQLGLSREIMEASTQCYREYLQLGWVNGRSIEGVAAAVVYLTTRQRNILLLKKELAGVAKVPKKKLYRTIWKVRARLAIDFNPGDPKLFIQRLASTLTLEPFTLEIALKLLGKAQAQRATQGWIPAGIAASVIYLAGVLTGDRRTQKEIASIVDVTEVTIRNQYKILIKKLDIDIIKTRGYVPKKEVHI